MSSCHDASTSKAPTCADWSSSEWEKVEVLLKCGTGKDASSKQELQVRLVACHKVIGCIHLITIIETCIVIHCWVSAEQDIWPQLTNLKWIHSASAGVEKLLFPELVNSPVMVTNAKVSTCSHSCDA